MSISLLDSITNKELEKSKTKTTKNLELFIKANKREILEAFLGGCNRLQIYTELVNQKKFFGSLSAFYNIFNSIFPDADELRKSHDIKQISEMTGRSEDEIAKKIESITEKKKNRNKDSNNKRKENNIVKSESKKNKKNNDYNNELNNNLSNNSYKKHLQDKKNARNEINNEDNLNDISELLNLSEEEKKKKIISLTSISDLNDNMPNNEDTELDNCIEKLINSNPINELENYKLKEPKSNDTFFSSDVVKFAKKNNKNY